jgi:hypothetical protein
MRMTGCQLRTADAARWMKWLRCAPLRVVPIKYSHAVAVGHPDKGTPGETQRLKATDLRLLPGCLVGVKPEARPTSCRKDRWAEYLPTLEIDGTGLG